MTIFIDQLSRPIYQTRVKIANLIGKKVEGLRKPIIIRVRFA